MKTRIALVVISCVVSAATGVVLSRGGPAQSQARARPLIGLSLDTLKEERWQKDRDMFIRKAEELGADVLVQSANSDDTRQIQDVEALISRRVEALVIVPHNAGAMAKAVRLAHDAGIPVVAYDRMITDSDPDLYASFDAVMVGEAQARYLVEQLRKKGRGTKRIVRIHGAKTDNNAFLVKQGQENVLKPVLESGFIQVVHEDWAENWKPENAKKIVNAAITRVGPSIDAVLAANDGTAGGAIQALTEEGLAGKVMVMGQDAELAACQRIANGTQTATIYKPLHVLAGKAAEAAFRLARSRPVVASGEVDNGTVKVPAILVDVVAVDKGNMMDTVVKDAFHPVEAIYRDVPEALRPRK
ncbi:MAG: substrate-binding domain-containing protein [Elusimicrobiota bacterium]